MRFAVSLPNQSISLTFPPFVVFFPVLFPMYHPHGHAVINITATRSCWKMLSS